MQKYWNTVQDEHGNPRYGASVAVQQNGVNSTIYSDSAGLVPKVNPLTTDATRGYFEFYAAAGTYDLVIFGVGFASYTITNGAQVGLPGGDVTYTPVSGTFAGIATTVQTWLDRLLTAAATTGAALVGFIQSGTGAVARTTQAKLRESVSVFDYMTAAQIADVQSFAPTLDVSSAVQLAINAVKAAGGGTILLPPGNYKIGTTLNLANLQNTVINFQGSGRGDDVYNTVPTNGSNFYGVTGTQAVIETQGSHYVGLRDFGIYSLLGDSSRSAVGIFIGRTTVQASAQFHNYQRLNIWLADKAGANGSRGSIGLYNLEGEHGSFEHLALTCDMPLVQYDNNALTYVPTYGIISNVASSTVNSYHECAFVTLTTSVMELRGAQSSSWIDCYYGTTGSQGTVAVSAVAGSNANANLIFFGGQIETFDSFIQLPDGTGHVYIDTTFASSTATGPMVLCSVGNNQKVYGLDAHFNNPHTLSIPIVGVGSATGSTIYGGKLTLDGGNNLNSVGLKLLGSVIEDLNATPATVTLAANSIYTLRTSTGLTMVGATTLSSATTLSAALTYGGVTLSNAVTGTGSMVLSANAALTGTTTAVDLSVSDNIRLPPNTPAQLTANQAAYNPSTAGWWRISSNGAGIIIRGIAGGVDGRELLISNVGAFSITFVHEDGLDSAANRVNTGAAAANLVLGANDNAFMMYDGTTSRWRVMSYKT